MTAWDEYYLWNDAIAGTLFPEVEESRPVYLDLEEDSQRALGECLGIPWDAVERELVRTVRATLNLDAAKPSLLFKTHTEALERWLSVEVEGPPPVLPLLSIFSLAAERMSAGQGLSASNYYGRLNDVLELEPDFHITTAYQRVAEQFWGALNRWLEEVGGSRGLPTARAVTHRYVGLSVSQALVRDVDRDNLIDFFLTHGYPPGSIARPKELVLPLDSWIQQHPSPVSHQLRQLWQRRATREEISNVVANALQTWDGRVARNKEGGAVGGRRIALSVSISNFPKKRLSLTALVFLEEPTEPREAQLLSSGEPRSIAMLPGIHSALSLGQRGELEHRSLLEGLLRVRDSRSGVTAQRLPKRLVVFRKDSLSNRMIEATQGVMLGEELVVLTREELKRPLLRLLAACARPGFDTVPDNFEGLPKGWTAIRGVEVFNAPDDSLVSAAKDLEALRPLSDTNLVTTGGLALPGLTRNRWHLWSPPEITAVSNHPDGFEVHVRVDDEIVTSVSDHEGVAIVRIADIENLEPADYRVEVVSNDKAHTRLAEMTIRLRDADSPDERQWAAAQPLYRPLDEPRALLSALPADHLEGGERYLQGALIQAPARRARLREANVPDRPSWVANPGSKPRARRQHVPVAVPREDSCVYTGAHHEDLPLVPHDSKGRPSVPYIVSKCRNCGMTRRYLTNWWAIEKEAASRARPEHAVHDLTAIQPKVMQQQKVEWDLALDALMHTGGGTWHLFERVANQIEASALFVDSFARALENLGHLEIERTPVDLNPTAWEIGPSVLVKTNHGYFLSGYWPGSLTLALTDAVGTQPTIMNNAEGPASWFVPALPTAAALTELGATESPGWESIAQELDPLSALVETLPIRDVHVQGQLREFDLAGARWTDVSNLGRPGAYRMNHFTTMDILRTDQDMRDRTMRVGLVHLNKHAAALVNGRDPLMYYHENSKRLAVPLGMDLPGLYGRAVVLASGLLPVADLRKNLLVYVDVPRELAEHIYCLLSS